MRPLYYGLRPAKFPSEMALVLAYDRAKNASFNGLTDAFLKLLRQAAARRGVK